MITIIKFICDGFSEGIKLKTLECFEDFIDDQVKYRNYKNDNISWRNEIRDYVRDILDDEIIGHKIYIAYDESKEKVVGLEILFLNEDNKENDIGYINGMFVSKNYRGKRTDLKIDGKEVSIAKMLNHLSEEWFIINDISQINIFVDRDNENAFRFWNKEMQYNKKKDNMIIKLNILLSKLQKRRIIPEIRMEKSI